MVFCEEESIDIDIDIDIDTRLLADCVNDTVVIVV